MISSSKLTLSQSKTTIAQTPPPTDTTTKTVTQTHKQQKQRLQLYNSLFGKHKKKICDKTGLQFISSLNYSLHRILHLSDKYWVLSVIDVYDYDTFYVKQSKWLISNKLNQIGTVINQFCKNNANKLTGFKLKRNDLIIDSDYDNEDELDHDLYGLLIYCYPQLHVSEKYIVQLEKNIASETNERVLVGMAKMNQWETFDEWKKRAYKSLKYLKERAILETNRNDTLFFSDVNVNYINPNQSDEKDEKQQQQGEEGVVMKLGNKEEFESKIKEIANNEEYEWIFGLMEIDDFDLFVFNNNNNNKDIIEKEMFHLFEIFGNNKNEIQYFGYKLNANGSKYGLILNDSEDRNKCFIAAHSLIETLSSEIRMKCSFSLSIGSTRLIEDDVGMIDDLIERLNNNLKQANKNGGNKVCFAIGVDNSYNSINDDNYNVIEEKSSGVIEQYEFSAYLKSIRWIVNNGDLLDENDLNLKCDFDPTEESKFECVSKVKYKDIFYQVVAFIDQNNGKCGDDKTRYLEYPKWCLNRLKPKCSDKEYCKQCHDSQHNSIRNNGIFSLCSTIRKHIAVELSHRGQLENCASDSLYKTASKLCICESLLIGESKQYKLNKNWFANVYSFLIWQQAVVRILLHNLVCLHEKLQSKSQELREMDPGPDEEKHIEVKENDFLLLTILESYLDELISYLVLYYCCFDCQLWIGVFYPFIECGVGTKQLTKMLFDHDISNEKYTNEKESIKKSHFNQIVEEFKNGNIEIKRKSCEQDMKAMHIFKRLIYDVYQPDGGGEINVGIPTAKTIANSRVQNAFNFTNQVCAKLRETMDNIQTQRMNDKSNDLEKDKCNQERKDDWVINDNGDVNRNNIVVPSFIRLFVIRRIIDKYIKNNTNNKNDKTKKEIIKKLARGFKDDKKNEPLVINIVTRLIKYGVKKYMNKYYNEKEQSNIIEDVFNKIILKTFSQEYNKMIQCGTNNDKTNDNYYKNFLFNSSDLMNKIFQYLEWGKWFDDDLYECSLVSSHWLYHVWNAKSVYHINFEELVEDDIDNRKWTRIWQRLSNVKSVHLHFSARNSNTIAVNKLSMFKLVEKVDVDVYARAGEVDKCISYVIQIMSRCKDRIKYCRVKIDAYGSGLTDFETPSPLRLPKAQYVEIGDLWFYRQWTNECRQLKLFELENISKDWCKFVIENCDCSNITTLILDEVTFDINSINNVVLKQFALNFCNLKTLEITVRQVVDDNVLLFWQLLKPIILKNITKVKLKVNQLRYEDYRYKDYQYNLFSKTMDEKDLKIDTYIIGHMHSTTIKSIQARDHRGLKQLAIPDDISYGPREGKNLLNIKKLKCESINTFELKGYDISFVNPLLEWKMITEKRIFVIIDVYGYYRHGHHSDAYVLSLFKQLFENVYQLLLKQIALNIKIKFGKVTDSKLFESHLSLYSSYFENNEFLSKYNSPNCNNNNLCLPRSKPYTYFYINDSKKDKWQRYFVFGATNVQIK